MKTRLRRGLTVAAVAAVAGALLPAAPAALASTTAGSVSGFSVATTTGSAVTDPAVAPIVDGTPGSGSLTLNGKTAAGAAFQIAIAADATTTLTAGSTVPLVDDSTTSAGLSVAFSGAATQCTVASGTADVVEVERDASNNLTSIAVNWSGLCDAAVGGTTSGQLRWNATAGYSGFDAPNTSFAFADSYIGEAGATHTFTWTARGTDPVTALPASIVTTESPESFIITKDDCKAAAAPLQPGDTCAVTVQVAPRIVSVPEANIVLGDPSAAPTYGSAIVSVNGKYGAKGTFNPLAPKRILDTRTGLGAPKALVGPGKSIKVTVLGKGGVPPTAVSAVSLNLTLVGTTAATYVTAYPSGTTKPTASSINAPKGFTGANSITVRPGADGTITLFNATGSTHMLADVTGYYTLTQGARAPGGDFHLVAPERIVDTRTDGGGPLPAGYYIDQGLDYDPVLGSVRAYALNVTVTNATANGYVTVWSGDMNQNPSTFSTVNYVKGQTRTNTVVTPALYAARPDPTGYYGPGFAVVNGGTTGSVNVIVDVQGIYTAQGGAGALRYKPLASPQRIVDSRYGLGASKWTANSTRTVNAPGTVAGFDTWALLGNAALVKPTASTFMTFFAAGSPRPGTSNLNAPVGATVANGAIVPMGAANDFSAYNSTGSVDALYDVTGSFEAFPPSPAALSGAKTGVSPKTAAGAKPSGAARGSLPSATRKLTGAAAPLR